MSAIKPILLLATVVLPMCPVVMAELAGDTGGGSTGDRPSFQMGSRQEFVPTLPPATRIFVTNGTETFALLTPAGYRVDNDVRDRVQLVNQQQDCFIIFRVVPLGSDNKTPLDAGYCHTALSNRYPAVKIIEEFPMKTGGLSGLAFDIRWKGHADITRASRVVFVSTPTGILEFSLICNPDKFRQARHDFDYLLLTFRASKDGKLEIRPRSDSL